MPPMNTRPAGQARQFGAGVKTPDTSRMGANASPKIRDMTATARPDRTATPGPTRAERQAPKVRERGMTTNPTRPERGGMTPGGAKPAQAGAKGTGMGTPTSRPGPGIAPVQGRFAKGGKVDGCCVRGKTKGKMC